MLLDTAKSEFLFLLTPPALHAAKVAEAQAASHASLQLIRDAEGGAKKLLPA